MASGKGTLTLRRPIPGGQMTGIIALPGIPAYVEVFNSQKDAEDFGEKHSLEVVGLPTETE